MDLPLVLIEAMLLERAVLVLEGTAAAELSDDGGARACPADIAALTGVSQELLGDAALRTALGARARAAALERYRPQAIAAQYESLYDELLV
jgi:glycosyltransferase involved in cell wall biosynthesis